MNDKPKVWLHLGLFLGTLATTTLAGGLAFSLTLMSILLFHEMGHYLTARYHGVQASLPYFIPAPPFFLIGTFGAFIRMRSRPVDRRALFDVAAAGPLAGLVLAVPAVVVGFQLSTVDAQPGEGLTLGSSLLLTLLSKLTLGILPEEANIVIHPIGFAGWIGFFVTALNLLPVGQLDGGHVVYALFGARHIWISRLAFLFIFSLGLLRWWDGWLIWGILLLFLGFRHPTCVDPYTPLDFKRTLLGWGMLGVLIVTFIPAPFSIREPTAQRQDRVPHSRPVQAETNPIGEAI